MGMKKPPPGEGRGLVASRPGRGRRACGPGQPRAQVTGGAQALGSPVWPCHRVPLVGRDPGKLPAGVLFRLVTGGAVGVQVWIQAETDAVCVANLVDCIGWWFHGVAECGQAKWPTRFHRLATVPSRCPSGLSMCSGSKRFWRVGAGA